MNAVEMVSKTNRGLLYENDSSDEENELAVNLIETIARHLGEVWEDSTNHEEVCVTLLTAFRKGRLILAAEGEDILVVDKIGGEVKVRFPANT